MNNTFDIDSFLKQNSKLLTRVKLGTLVSAIIIYVIEPILGFAAFKYFGTEGLNSLFVIGVGIACGWLISFAYWLLKLNSRFYKSSILTQLTCMEMGDLKFSPNESLNEWILREELFKGIEFEKFSGEDLFKGTLYGRDLSFCDVCLKHEEYDRVVEETVVTNVRGLTFCAYLPLADRIAWGNVNLLLIGRNTLSQYSQDMRNSRSLSVINANLLPEHYDAFVNRFEVYGYGTEEEKKILNLPVQKLLAFVMDSFETLVGKEESHKTTGLAIVIRNNRLMIFIGGKEDLFDISLWGWNLEDNIERDFKHLYFVSQLMKQYSAFDTIEPDVVHTTAANVSNDEVHKPHIRTNLDGTINIDGKSLLQQRREAEQEIYAKKEFSMTIEYTLLLVSLLATAAAACYFLLHEKKPDGIVDFNSKQAVFIDSDTDGDWECVFHIDSKNTKYPATIFALIPDSAIKLNNRFLNYNIERTVKSERGGGIETYYEHNVPDTLVVYRKDAISDNPNDVRLTISNMFGFVHSEYTSKVKKKTGTRDIIIYEGEMLNGKRNGYGVNRDRNGKVEEGYWNDEKAGYTITFQDEDRIYKYNTAYDDTLTDSRYAKEITFIVRNSGSIFYEKELVPPGTDEHKGIMRIKTKTDRYIAQSRKDTDAKRQAIHKLIEKYRPKNEGK